MNRHTFTTLKINTESIDNSRFIEAVNSAYALRKGNKGIGTLAEKSVHAVLKHYYAHDPHYHEVKIDNYIADALVDGEIYEIQSKAFYLLKNKLRSFLKNYDVTIIHPITVKKTIRYVNPETGEISESRISNKKQSIYDILPELYGIKEFLNNDKLHFILCFIEAEEYKLLDGYGKNHKLKATKTDCVPTKLVGEFYINKKEDLLNLLPGYEDQRRLDNCPLSSEFTTNDISTYSGHNAEYARYLVNILTQLKLIKNIGKKSRCKLYKDISDNTPYISS